MSTDHGVRRGRCIAVRCVRLVACAMSMDIMEIHPDELIDGVEHGGVASYLAAAEQSNVNLFV